MAVDRGGPGPRTVARGRCRCGHYPSQHMVTRPVEGPSNYRLDPGGPCVICGEATCRAYVPAGTPPAPG